MQAVPPAQPTLRSRKTESTSAASGMIYRADWPFACRKIKTDSHPGELTFSHRAHASADL